MTEEKPYPSDACVAALRQTVKELCQCEPTAGQCLATLVESMLSLQDAAAREDWPTTAKQAGMIATVGLVLQLQALVKIRPKAKA